MSDHEARNPLPLPSSDVIRARIIACRTECNQLKKLLKIVRQIEIAEEAVDEAEKRP